MPYVTPPLKVTHQSRTWMIPVTGNPRVGQRPAENPARSL